MIPGAHCSLGAPLTSPAVVARHERSLRPSQTAPHLIVLASILMEFFNGVRVDLITSRVLRLDAIWVAHYVRHFHNSGYDHALQPTPGLTPILRGARIARRVHAVIRRIHFHSPSSTRASRELSSRTLFSEICNSPCLLASFLNRSKERVWRSSGSAT